MLDVPFSVRGFWLGSAVLAVVALLATLAMFRWMLGNPERQRTLSIFAMGHVTTMAVLWLSVYVYYPVFYWLAAKLGL